MTRAALLAVLCLAPAPAHAGGPRLTPAAETQLEEGLRRLYSLDYAASRAAFRRVVELEPDNPFGYLFEAGGIWWQSSQEYGLFQSTPALQGLFEQDVEAALRKAEPLLSSKDPAVRADGHFVSGMALGTLGQWRLMKGHWMDAYFAGRKALKHLRKCAKLDPEYHDVYLGLGVFDYQAAHWSGFLRVGRVLGMGGDEARGIAELNRAMERSRHSSIQAAVFLLTIHAYDKKDDRAALAVIERLRKAYPESPYFIAQEAEARARLGEWEASAALARELFRLAQADPAAFAPKWLTLACGYAGPECLSEVHAARLLAWADKALEQAARSKPDAYQGLLRAGRGALLDVLGRRREAVAEHARALACPAGPGRALAAAGRSAPLGRDEALRRLRALSRGEPAGAGPSNGFVTRTP